MAVALMPAVPLGVWAGKRLHDRLDEQRLYFWCYLLVGVAGLQAVHRQRPEADRLGRSR